jgi:DNA-binding NtrC family response regulator
MSDHNLERGSILIVDDDAVVRESLAKWFTAEGHRVGSAAGGQQALAMLESRAWDVLLADIKMPGIDGMELQARVHTIDANLPVILMTGYATVESAVTALKNGAYDYITKPFDPDELVHLVNKAIEHRRARAEVERLRESIEQALPPSELIGQSPAMKRVHELIQTVAPTDATALITGESGTGKELVARAIHNASNRRFHPMVVIHCGALTETLLESELFGYERGAFTGAHERRKGKFEVADGGSVFLDEIGDISLHTQTDLLRVLQEKEIVRVGGHSTVRLDFRCIAATNKRLETLVADGKFRPDLFYRLNVFNIDVPPLRQRREDIPLLAGHFLHKFGDAMNRATPRLSQAALDLLLEHHWPGNVRELENSIERAMLIARGDEIDASAFPFQMRAAETGSGGQSLEDIERRHIEKILQETAFNLSKLRPSMTTCVRCGFCPSAASRSICSTSWPPSSPASSAFPVTSIPRR